MTSYQQSANNSKSAKFVQVNPLEPMIKPFSNGQINDEDRNMQQALSDKLNERLMKSKHHHHHGSQYSNTAASNQNASYATQIQQHQVQQQQQQQLIDASFMNQHQSSLQLSMQQHDSNDENHHDDNLDDNEDDDDDDYDDDDDLDDDPVYREIRHKRMLQLKQQVNQDTHYKSLGHGQYRTITQDEFLPECSSTSSSIYIVLHFYSETFTKCRIMDHHLQMIASQCLECKFLRINAEKAPFFITKLKIQILPTILVFHNGQIIQRLIGFEGLITNHVKKSTNYGGIIKDNVDDDFNASPMMTMSLKRWLTSTGAIQPTRVTDEEDEYD